LEIPHTFILKTVISFYSHANVPAPDLHLCKGVLFCRRVIKYLFAHIPVLMCFLRAGAMKMQFRRGSKSQPVDSKETPKSSAQSVK